MPADEVSPFDPIAYRELVEPPSSYHEYLRQRREARRRARPFAYVPHVLVTAPIDVSGLILVRASA